MKTIDYVHLSDNLTLSGLGIEIINASTYGGGLVHPLIGLEFRLPK